MKSKTTETVFFQPADKKTLLQAIQRSGKQQYPRLNNSTLSQYNISNRININFYIPSNHQNPYCSYTISTIVCQHPRSWGKLSDRARNFNPEGHWVATTGSHFSTALESQTWKHQAKLTAVPTFKNNLLYFINLSLSILTTKLNQVTLL